MAKNKKHRRRKKGSIFRKYFIRSGITVTLGFTILGFIMMVFIGSQWWDDKAVNLKRNAKSISEAYISLVENRDGDRNSSYNMSDGEFLQATLRTMSNSTLSQYFITDVEGNVIFCGDCDGKNSSDCTSHKDYTVNAEYMKRAVNNGFSDYVGGEDFEIGSFVVSIPIKSEDGKTMAVAFAVEDVITGLVPYIIRILESYFYSLLIALVGVFFVLFFITKDITGPLSDMQEITRHYAKGDFEHQAKENYKSRDFNDFAKSLNKMGYELKINEESRKSFVANVSHELKTPMTSIGGFIDGIMDGTIPPEEEKKYLGIVSNEVKRLSRMVVSMLNLSKIEAGEIQLSPIIYDVSSQVFETLLTFEKKIDEKHIEIEGFEDIGSVMMKADKDLIQQVVYNLIDNAVKFTPERGKITVFAHNNGEATTVTIRNSGNGVSEDEIARIFERFYKVDKSRSFDTKGVGLGLYIVKTIINMHDGDIRASSKQGEYTEFSFEIPFIAE